MLKRQGNLFSISIFIFFKGSYCIFIRPTNFWKCVFFFSFWIIWSKNMTSFMYFYGKLYFSLIRILKSKQILNSNFIIWTLPMDSISKHVYVAIFFSFRIIKSKHPIYILLYQEFKGKYVRIIWYELYQYNDWICLW